MMPTRMRNPGEFCWINMITPRPAEARAFFEQLLGWTYFEMPGLGHGIEVGGQPVGGLFDLEAPNVPPGVTPTLGVMIKVEDVAATAEKITSLGGSAKKVMDIFDQGRMVVAGDPNGGRFDLWEPKKMPGTQVDITLPGAPSWFETLTTDVDAATRFYADLFGWEREVKHYEGFDYTVFRQDGRDVAGLMAITPEMTSLEPHWATYFTVKDADAAAATATELGAKVHVPPTDIPGIGRFCGIISPQGVMFYVIAYPG